MKKQTKYLFQKIHGLFLWSSGANMEVLKQVPSEHSKYFGIGGTILFTALMATFAGGYGFYTAFRNVYTASIFGVFWGALIFNLDRYIVSTFGSGDGKRTISKQELIEAFPRIIMAILLGLVIATPLELRLFEKSITVEIEKIKQQEVEELISGDVTLNSDLDSLKKEKNFIEKNLQGINSDSIVSDAGNLSGYIDDQVVDVEHQVALVEKNILNEERKLRGYLESYVKFSSPGKPMKNGKYIHWKGAAQEIKWYGKYSKLSDTEKIKDKEKGQDGYYAKYKYYNAMDQANQKAAQPIQAVITAYYDEIAEMRTKIAALKGKKAEKFEKVQAEAEMYKNNKNIELKRVNDAISDLEKKKVELISFAKESTRQYNGLLAQLRALGNITSRDKSLFFARLLITFLFIFIEIAPILFKMMTERGPYDDMMERIKHEVKVKQLLLQSNLNQEVNMTVKLNTAKMEQKLNAELLANEELLKSIANAQAEIAKKAVEKWKEDQLGKMADGKNSSGAN